MGHDITLQVFISHKDCQSKQCKVTEGEATASVVPSLLDLCCRVLNLREEITDDEFVEGITEDTLKIPRSADSKVETAAPAVAPVVPQGNFMDMYNALFKGAQEQKVS